MGVTATMAKRGRADPLRQRIPVDPVTSNAAFTAMALNCRASRAWGAVRLHDCLRHDVVFWKGVRPTKDFPPLRIDEIAYGQTVGTLRSSYRKVYTAGRKSAHCWNNYY